jgi:hypothetical protein
MLSNVICSALLRGYFASVEIPFLICSSVWMVQWLSVVAGADADSKITSARSSSFCMETFCERLTSLTSLLPQPPDCSYYVGRRILTPPFCLQKHTDLREHDFAHFPYSLMLPAPEARDFVELILVYRQVAEGLWRLNVIWLGQFDLDFWCVLTQDLMHMTFFTEAHYSNRSINTSDRIQHVVVLERTHGLGRWFRFFRGKIVRGGPKISLARIDTSVIRETFSAAIKSLLWVREVLGPLFYTTINLV